MAAILGFPSQSRRRVVLLCLLCLGALAGCQNPDRVWITRAELTTIELLEYRRIIAPVRAEANEFPKSVAGLTLKNRRESADYRYAFVALTYKSETFDAHVGVSASTPPDQFNSIDDQGFIEAFSRWRRNIESRGIRWEGPQTFIEEYVIAPEGAQGGEPFRVARFHGPDFATYVASAGYGGLEATVQVKIAKSADEVTKPKIEAFIRELGSHLPALPTD